MEDVNLDQLIRQLKAQGIRISVDNSELNIKAPKGKLTKELLQELKEKKSELITYFSSVLIEEDIISKAEIGADYAISYAQRRLWILSQFEETSIAYNMPFHMELKGNYDIACFKKAIGSVIERHEILRTVLKKNEKDDIRQWILPKEDLDFNIGYYDFRNDINVNEKVENYIYKDSSIAFDLENGPLLRIALLHKGEGEYMFFCNMHHIICDGWSMDVLVKDIFAFYEAYIQQKEPKLPELKIQYKDYAAWQNAQVCKEEFNTYKNYWLDKLSGNLPLLSLPSNKLRPKVKTHNGESLETFISSEITQKLKSFSQEQGGSLFMGLLAAWNVLFYKYTSQRDIIIGTPVAGRDHADLENQVGFYINTLVLRNEVDPEETFIDFYNKVKVSALKSYDHQKYPFDRLVQDLDLKRDLSRSVLFDVMVKLLNTGEKAAVFEIEPDEVDQIVETNSKMSRFDLNITFKEKGEYLYFNVCYNPDVYQRQMVEGLIGHYKHLLIELLKNPIEKIGAINYLKPEENHKLLQGFNDTKRDYTTHKTLVDVIEERAVLTPEKIGFIDEKRKVTYDGLNRESNQIAWSLKELGVQKGEYVCLHMSRKVELIEAVLGVIKTGAAYLPFEPEVPADRKVSILNDLHVKVIITDSTHLKSVVDFVSEVNNLVKIICLDYSDLVNVYLLPSARVTFLAEIQTQPTKNLQLEISPLDEAYVIFTSGSTGKPKGVVVQHRPVLNLIEWVNSTYEVSTEDKLLMVASISFDLSVYDIFGIIHAGATGRIASHDELQSPIRLVEIIHNESITFWDSAPVALIRIVPELLYKKEKGLNGQLRLVFLSGDWIPLTLPNDLKKCFSDVRVISLGGATEAVVWSNHFEVDKLDPNWVSIPYGKPIWNAKYYILDSYLLPCPVGIEGDLYIGGEVLAKEYKNDEILSSSKFIANPFEKGTKMYKTGDRARFYEDGNIEFLGRLDDQVKIRGYRIELGDIKHVIEQHNLVKDVIVTTKGQKTDRQLVAYYTFESALKASDLKLFISTKLPEYMVPAYLIPLDQFPVTTNGKLDRKALPDPSELIIESAVEYIQPRNEIERSLVKIWSKILGLPEDKIGIKNNFFDLGGDSLKVTLIISKIQNEFEIKIDYRQLFLEPTIENLYKHINSFQLLENQMYRIVDSNNELVF